MRMKRTRSLFVVAVALLVTAVAWSQSRVSLVIIASEGPAQVLLSGRLIGVANPRLTTQVTPGNYELVVRKPGLPEFRKQITVGSSGLTVEVQLGGAAAQPAPQTSQTAPKTVQQAPQPQTSAPPANLPAPSTSTPAAQPSAAQPSAAQPPAAQPSAAQPSAAQPSAASSQSTSSSATRQSSTRFEAEAYVQASSGVRPEGISAPETGISLAFIENNAWAYYGAIQFGPGVQIFRARTASATSGGVIALRSGSPTGPELGRCTVPSTGGWHDYVTVETQLSGANGRIDLYLVFLGPAGYLFNINWFEFSQSAGSAQTVKPAAQAAGPPATNPPATNPQATNPPAAGPPAASRDTLASGGTQATGGTVPASTGANPAGLIGYMLGFTSIEPAYGTTLYLNADGTIRVNKSEIPFPAPPLARWRMNDRLLELYDTTNALRFTLRLVRGSGWTQVWQVQPRPADPSAWQRQPPTLTLIQ
jgi:outer membrane biosynthesis protein TonB